jgi:hypothetical protein
MGIVRIYLSLTVNDSVFSLHKWGWFVRCQISAKKIPFPLGIWGLFVDLARDREVNQGFPTHGIVRQDSPQ